MSDAAETARSLREAARKHKKASRYHRRKSREYMQKLKVFLESCGIRLSIIEGGGKNHGPEDADGVDDGRI